MIRFILLVVVIVGLLMWAIADIKKRKLKIVDKAKEAERLINEAKKLYNDVDENIQKEIDDTTKELELKKKISKKTKERLDKIIKI